MHGNIQTIKRYANVRISYYTIDDFIFSFIIHFRFKTSFQNVMSKHEKPRWQIIDHFFTKAVPTTHLPDDPDKQCTVDEDASSEEYSNVALPQDIATERSAASCIDSSP